MSALTTASQPSPGGSTRALWQLEVIQAEEEGQLSLGMDQMILFTHYPKEITSKDYF